MRKTFAAGALAAALALAGTATAGAGGATIGPDGYKGLHLGQTAAEAEATGLLVDRQPGECTRYYLNPSEGTQNPGGGVWIDQRVGLVFVSGTERTHTPEGITMGSTLDQVREAYPQLRPVPPTDYVYTADVPGHPGANYRFAVDEQQRVRDYGVNADDMGTCASQP